MKNQHIVASIQARMGSSRLPGKVMMPMGYRTVLGRVVDRAMDSETIDTVAITTGNKDRDDMVGLWCEKKDIPCYRSSEENLVRRHRTVASKESADALVRITGDCAFMPPQEIDRAVTAHLTSPDSRFTRNGSEETMPVGTNLDVFDVSVLDDLFSDGETHPMKPILRESENWSVQILDPVSPWADYRDEPIAIDTPQDYWRLKSGLETVGDDPLDILKWLDDGQPPIKFGRPLREL